MIIALAENSKQHAKFIFHIIRIFLPTLTWKDLLNDKKKEAIILEIIICDEYMLFNLKNNCCLKIKSTDSSSINKTIKLGVYQLLDSFINRKGPSWGILTGIRPTKIVHKLWDKGFTAAQIKSVLQDDYLIKEDKIKTLLDITSFQRRYLLSGQTASKKISIYISIPFCPSKCSYCSFPSYLLSKWEKEIDTYLECLIEEIIAVGKAIIAKNITIENIYIGGGTPTVLTHEQLKKLLEAISFALVMDTENEFTVEAGRPDTIDEYKLQLLKQFGVNRISINPQTMVDRTLKKIGRNHTSEDIKRVFQLARQIGFEKINMDLILALPGENLEDVNYTLNEIIKLGPNNVTIHVLSLKRSSKYDLRLLKDNDEVLISEMLALSKEKMREKGMFPYYLYRQRQMIANLENIGYSEYDYPCTYNIQMIEERQTIIGLGVGATSKIVLNHNGGLVNKTNPKDLFFYMENLEEVIKEKVKMFYKQ